MLPSSLLSTDEIVAQTIDAFKKEGAASAGDDMALTRGTSASVGATNVMRIQHAVKRNQHYSMVLFYVHTNSAKNERFTLDLLVLLVIYE